MARLDAAALHQGRRDGKREAGLADVVRRIGEQPRPALLQLLLARARADGDAIAARLARPASPPAPRGGPACSAALPARGRCGSRHWAGPGPGRGSSGSPAACRHRPPCRRRRRCRPHWPAPPCRRDRRASGRARRARCRGGTPPGRGSRRRCGDRSPPRGRGRRWSASTPGRPPPRGRGPRPAARPSRAPGRRARNRRSCTGRGRAAPPAGPRRAGDISRSASQQPGAVIGDRAQPDAFQQVGEGAHHHVPVLDDIADARRRAGVVFEHHELARPVAHDVRAADVDIGAVRQVHAAHDRPVVRRCRG